MTATSELVQKCDIQRIHGDLSVNDEGAQECTAQQMRRKTENMR